MNKVKELRIDSSLWATPARLVNLLDFEPEKISIETENNGNNNMKIHNIRYKNGGFYLTILINKISIIKYGKTFLKLLMEDMVN